MTPPPPTAASAARVRAATAVPAPLRLPPAPRRVSGPARREQAAARPAPGASAVLIRLIDHPWLERLIRGRAWIAIVATALLGIVAMQVALLRLGAQIGGQTSAVNSMQQRISSMKATIGGLEASSGLATSPRSLDMLYPPPGAVTYLQLNPGDARLAVDRIESPSAAALAATAAHPLRRVIHTVTPSTGVTGLATGTPVGATATGTATALSTSGAGTTGTGTSAGTSTTSSTAGTTASSSNGTATVTPSTTTAPDTTQATSLTGGAAATSAAGGTTAPTGTTSGAGVTGG